MHVSAGRFTYRNRLNRPVEFKQVFKSHCRSVDNSFIIIACINNLNYARLGMAISSRRVIGAARRNRLKRLIRESFRINQNVLAGLDLVVTINKIPVQIINKTTFNSLQRHWQKLAKCKDSL